MSSTAFQTITDYSKVVGATTFDTINAAALVIGTQVVVAGSGSATITTGLATFNALDTTFALHLAAVEKAIGNATAGVTAIWQEGADSYVFIGDTNAGVGAGDTLIKLTGVTAGALTIAGNAITAMA